MHIKGVQLKTVWQKSLKTIYDLFANILELDSTCADVEYDLDIHFSKENIKVDICIATFTYSVIFRYLPHVA